MLNFTACTKDAHQFAQNFMVPKEEQNKSFAPESKTIEAMYILLVTV